MESDPKGRTNHQDIKLGSGISRRLDNRQGRHAKRGMRMAQGQGGKGTCNN